VKILFLCHRLPFPPSRGGRIRPFNMLKHLSRDHEVALATLRRVDDAAQAVEALQAVTARRIIVPVGERASWTRTAACLPTAIPSSFAYFHSSRLAAAIRAEQTRPCDLVLVHSAAMGRYVGATRAATMLDFGDMDSQKWFAYAGRTPLPVSLGYRLEGAKVRRAEVRLARRFDLATCTTRAELETLRGYGAARQTGWFPNGVDAEYFRPVTEPYDPDAICFLGRMDYYPNQDAVRWFCEDVFPQLRAQRPRLTLSIIGANPPRAVLRLGERPGIRVTGTVPDVRPHARRAACSIAPLHIARGTQNKILESLAMGVPVVASPLAAAGTDTVPGEHLLTAREPREFIAAILRLSGDPHERRRLAHAGRQRVLSHHDWGASMRRLDGLLEECLVAASAAPRLSAGSVTG
jgi:sugar transferase (PEP-CTERM/EpsH1 system associated)